MSILEQLLLHLFDGYFVIIDQRIGLIVKPNTKRRLSIGGSDLNLGNLNLQICFCRVYSIYNGLIRSTTQLIVMVNMLIVNRPQSLNFGLFGIFLLFNIYFIYSSAFSYLKKWKRYWLSIMLSLYIVLGFTTRFKISVSGQQLLS